MRLDVTDQETCSLIVTYIDRFALPTANLWITTDRATFVRWLGRPVRSSYGGAYVYLTGDDAHAVLINLARIDRGRPRSLEIVVAEELMHMRDHLDGDRRRHAKHGHDRIAARVASVTGASLDEVRSALVPVRRRRLRYLYACPVCHAQIRRRVRGTWSCGRCSPRFDRRFELRLLTAE